MKDVAFHLHQQCGEPARSLIVTVGGEEATESQMNAALIVLNYPIVQAFVASQAETYLPTFDPTNGGPVRSEG